MEAIRSHRDLRAWQLGMELCKELYRLTKTMPESERFGLISQLRRAAVSVPSNIAEGYGRGTTADYIRFLRAARGSLYEIDTQTLIAMELHFVSEETFTAIQKHVNHCGQVLAALIRSLERKIKK
jgi:four helix bundle protein